MRNLRLAAAGLLAGAITLVSAGSAFAYGDEPILVPEGGAGAAVVEAAPGGQFSKSGNFGGAEVESYSATLLGDNVGGGENTTTWTVSGTAPQEEGRYAIVFTITTDEDFDLSASGLKSGFAPAEATYTQSLTLVVGDGVAGDAGAGAGAGAGGNGALPDTGGANLLLVAGGAALVVAGAGVVAVRRRNA